MTKSTKNNMKAEVCSCIKPTGTESILTESVIGHSNFNVTANYYSHLEFDSKISSADAIATALGNAPGNGDIMPGNTSGRA